MAGKPATTPAKAPAPTTRPKPVVAAPRTRPAPPPPRRKRSMTRRVVSGVFLLLFTAVVAMIALAVLLLSHLPDLTGFDDHPGRYIQRHIERGLG